METLWREWRYAWRSLGRSPGFAAAAILALAVGIGANAANFSVFDAIVWHAIPGDNFGRLVLINGIRVKNGGWTGVSFPDYRDWQSQARSFEGLAAYRYRQFDETGQGPAEQVQAASLTPNYFSVLGAKPLLGRTFAAEEAEPAQSHRVVLSYRFWQSQFDGDPAVIGRTIGLDHASYAIVGVMPREIEYPTVDLFVPLGLTPAEQADRSEHKLTVLGLLKPGVSLVQGQAEMAALSAGLAKAYPATNEDLSAYVRSLRVYINGNLSYAWGLMFAAAMGLVLLIACANVANLQLARGTARQREIAVRTSLGASRRAIVRQWLVESVLTALLGAVGGLIFAWIGIRLIGAGMPGAVAQLVSGWDRIRISPLSLAFTILIAAAAGILSGVLPALLSSKPDLSETLKEGGRSATPGRARRWLQGSLVVTQMVLAFVLLVATALLVRGFRGLTSAQDEFAPASVLLFHVDLPSARYAQPAQRLAFYQQALEKLSATPGAHSAAVFTTFPLSNNGTEWTTFEVAELAPAQLHGSPRAVTQCVSPGFFPMLNLRLLSGRNFTSGDGPRALPVAIVNRRLAERYWPAGGAVGRQIRVVDAGTPGQWLTVVGVVGDVLWDWTDQTPEMAIYRPYTQAPESSAFFALRDGSDPAALAPAVRQEMASLDPDLPLTGDLERHPEPLNQAIHESTGPLGLLAGMMAGLGLIAFGLAAIGVYSVMAYSVVERTHEIGVRMALGADSRSVLGLILRRGGLLLGIGLAIGLPVSYALARLLAGLIYGVRSTDPVAFASALAVLAAATLLAGYLPARQAARVDPVVTLRAE